jgi:hypothetical protein
VFVGRVSVELLVVSCILHLFVREPEFWREEVLREAVWGFSNVELESGARVVGVQANEAIALCVGKVLVRTADKMFEHAVGL